MLASRYVAAAVSLLWAAARGRPTQQFDQFSSTWHEAVQEIIQRKCLREFNDYKAGLPAQHSQRERVTRVLNCILTDMSDLYKVNIAASAVVLGSAPMILQALGSTTAETALLGLRRPLLSFLLAAGSPAVATLKSSEFIEMLARFVRGGETRNIGLPGFRWRRVHAGLRPAISLAEYVVVGVAATNVVLLAYEMGIHAILVFTPAKTWLPPLWTLLALTIHAGGTIALHLRVRVAPAEARPGDDPPPTGFMTQEERDEAAAAAAAAAAATSEKKKQRAGGGISIGIGRASSGFSRGGRGGGGGGWWTVPNEFIPSAFQRPCRLVWRREHAAFYAVSWFLSIVTVAHVLFGTLIFSSLLFFSVRDSVKVVARYAGSAIVCRAVVRFELAGLTEATTSTRDAATMTAAPVADEEAATRGGLFRADVLG
ncbi:hypothetical protein CDD83_1940 [Cordyceps sp. RAO-2017]|nr:hypothetical protein CDD83_1940 [Cordyceps sp. RAO-2017]